MRKIKIVLFIITILRVTLACAQTTDSTNPPEPPKYQPVIDSSLDFKGKPYPEMFLSDRDSNYKKNWEWSLPFLAQKVIDKGFSLPRPYGFSLIYTHLNQGINLNELQVGFAPNKPMRDINIVDLSGAKVDNVTWQAKLDAWILPFLNVFALLGTVTGTGSVPIAIDAGQAFEDIAPGYCATHVNQCNKVITASAPINYNGVNYGIGILLATGFQNFFFAMPLTYVVTDTNVSTANSYSFNMIPRFGYNILTARTGKFGVYIGANYLDSYADLNGSYVLPLSTTDIGQDVTVRYHLRESPIDRWNAIAGTNWELNERWSLIFELGFGTHRDMQTMNFAWRF